ncbi:MAG TPA: hypothetical protein VFD84_17255 [Candidatus Binatia bacterium]|nr:hypothetical protein [Candidatus Binatia bacterium]
MVRLVRKVILVASLGAFALLAACGGGADTGGTPQTPPGAPQGGATGPGGAGGGAGGGAASGTGAGATTTTMR